MENGTAAAAQQKPTRPAGPGQGQPLRVGGGYQLGSRVGDAAKPPWLCGRCVGGMGCQLAHLAPQLGLNLPQLSPAAIGRAVRCQPVEAAQQVAARLLARQGIPLAEQHRQGAGQVELAALLPEQQ